MKIRFPLVITIGVFDGVHLGHQALVRNTVSLAKKLKAKPVALTFKDHPMHVLKGGPRIPFLLPRNETFELLKEEGIQLVHALQFTKAFSKKSPEQFVQWLRGLGSLRGVVVGQKFRFGQGAKGDVSFLKVLGKKYGFQVRAVKPVRVGGSVVSSSLIRQLLMNGKMEEARNRLGRPYSIEGEVVHGKHMGHQIGFPTANLRCIQFLPKDGVYACAVRVGSKVYRAGMNLGKRPTFKDDDHHRQAEVHLLHYFGKLYGKRMKVYLFKYLRAEKKFLTPAHLVRQIKRDLAQVKKVPLTGFR
ncbi:MAG TPA: bifunctional riboflavin kinase/FAD synthetase [bacterium]